MQRYGIINTEKSSKIKGVLMTVSIERINPFVRTALLQPAVLEGESLRMAYDHRLFCVLEGTGEFLLEDCEYPVTRGSVVYIPPAVGYCFRGRLRVAVINYDITRACDDRKKAICPPPVVLFDKSLLFDGAVACGFERPFVFDGCEFLVPEFTDIVTAYSRNDGYSDALCSSQLKSVIVKLARHADGASRPESRLASKIDGYIRMYASEITSNEDIARHFGYHHVYLASVYKAHTGKTLHGAITDARIALACRWLLQTNASVESIAADIGFSSRAHFCTVFKSRMGVSPGVWRRRNVTC